MTTVYRYRGHAGLDEEYVEEGIVLARDLTDAKEKLRRRGIKKPRLKRVDGLKAWAHRFSASMIR